MCWWQVLSSTSSNKDKDKDLFIGPQEFVVGYSKAPEQPHSSARPICHSHNMTRTGREPATIRIAAQELAALRTAPRETICDIPVYSWFLSFDEHVLRWVLSYHTLILFYQTPISVGQCDANNCIASAILFFTGEIFWKANTYIYPHLKFHENLLSSFWAIIDTRFFFNFIFIFIFFA